MARTVGKALADRTRFAGRRRIAVVGVLLMVWMISGTGWITAGTAEAQAADTSDTAWWAGEDVRVYIARSPDFRNGMTSEEVRAIADAGFNVYGHRWIRPSWGSIDREHIATKVDLCAEHGLLYMSWMRGSIHRDPENPAHRMTWEDGTVQELHGPLSPALWEHLEEGLGYLAELGVEGPVVGAFLDFENYAEDKRGNLYHISYDRHALELFAEAEGIAAPPEDLDQAYGASWLEELGLKADFDRWQEQEFRERSRALRAHLDDINPAFHVGIYSGESMVGRIFAEELASEAAPVIHAPASSYGRPSTLLRQAESLEANRNRVLAGIANARERDYPFIYLAGIMPGYRQSDPEFTGKNMVSVADVADGYWVWDSLRQRDERWDDFRRWMRWANEDVQRGRHRLHLEPRLEAEQREVVTPQRQTDRPQVGVHRASDALMTTLRDAGDFEVHELEALSTSHLENFDVVILQNFNVALGPGSRVHRVLQDYVGRGGTLFITHNTGRDLESPFPDIAVRAYPEHRVSPANQVLDRRMVVRETANVLPEQLADVRFTAGFGDHIIYAPGPDGTVLVENHFGDAVYVVGEYGEGRVAFAGTHFAYREPLEEGDEERDALLGVVRWLEGGDQPSP